MLKGMRRSAKHILWPLIIALVITMGGYGVWYLVRPETSRTRIGAIWGEPVRLDEFIQTARAARAIAALSGQELERRELYMISWRRLLLHREAQRMGVSATRRDLARFLAQWPAFQVDGRFSADRYSLVLNRLGLEPATFEAQVEELLGIEVMRMIIQNQALVIPADAERTYERMNEEIRVEYARVGTEGISPLEGIPPEDISEYYRQNRGEFQVQTEIAISFILLKFDDFADPPPEAEDAENDPKSSLPEEETTVRAAGEEAAAARADAIIQSLVYEDSLIRPAQEFDLEIRESGYFALDGEIPGVGSVSEIGRMVGWMEEDEIASYPIRVENGFLIFQLTGVREARLREFEEAREEIREILLDRVRREEALNMAREKLLQIRPLVEDEERDFESAAREAGLETETTPFFTRQGGDDLPPVPQFATAAFLTPPGEVSDLIPGEDDFFFLSVLERKPPPPIPEDEKEEWLEIARRTRAELLYESWFSHLVRQSGFSITNEEFAP
jgi:peptidyl-prolyl cis-trans isomerase D